MRITPVEVRVGVAWICAHRRVVVEDRLLVPAKFRQGPAAVVVHVTVYAGNEDGVGELLQRVFMTPRVGGRDAAPVMVHCVLGRGDIDPAPDDFRNVPSKLVQHVWLSEMVMTAAPPARRKCRSPSLATTRNPAPHPHGRPRETLLRLVA